LKGVKWTLSFKKLDPIGGFYIMGIFFQILVTSLHNGKKSDLELVIWHVTGEMIFLIHTLKIHSGNPTQDLA
jgi:hypothetical protein